MLLPAGTKVPEPALALVSDSKMSLRQRASSLP